jgi:hypothetical protein
MPLAACDNGDLPPASSYATVQGIVLDRVTTKPISGAVVTIDTVLTATSDTDGKFSFEKVPSGIVDFSVEAKGYKVITSSATAEPGKTFVLNVNMAPPPE